MKLATWNIERLKHHRKIAEIIAACEDADADILVLTEYDDRVDLKSYPYHFSTKSLSDLDSKYYKSTERRVKIYSKYEVLRLRETYDEFTSCCAELNTEYGNLNVYGTIIGVLGNRCNNFKVDLPRQIEDYEKFSQEHNLCIAGDFNISFSDNYYYTKSGRDELSKCFEKAGLVNLTAGLQWNIDHIAISKDILKEAKIDLYEWNVDKALSDHKGVAAKIKVELEAQNKLAHNIA